MKIAVVLFNLGGPDNPAAVKPFLFNLFNDPAIIRLPQPFRMLIASLIAKKRTQIAQDIYAKIGGRSPIFENTQAQARALEEVLNKGGKDRFKCFIAMRYWHPFTDGAVHGVKTFAPDEIILLPLYPQFSTTTTASSLKEWGKAARKAGLTAPTKTICCYPEETGFIASLAASSRMAYERAHSYGRVKVLFSAHGLPEKIVRAGDPYQMQCEQTAAALVSAMNISDLDWTLCYQSRVGPLKWIGPATDEEIRKAGREKRPVVIVPIAFVSEHSETLVELDIEYRHVAERAGVPFYARVPVVGTTPGFIEGLAGLAQKAHESGRDCISNKGERLCPPQFSGCCQG
jgi:protoporphyrin/coproporphyrin ferrochelatase